MVDLSHSPWLVVGNVELKGERKGWAQQREAHLHLGHGHCQRVTAPE